MEAAPTDSPSSEIDAADERHGRDEHVERSIELDLAADELWELVATADGWSRWLSDTADLEVEPGAVGDVTDGEATRRVRIDAVEPGSRVGFTWWTDDDPGDAATVELRIEEVSPVARRLHIVERRLLRSTTSSVSMQAALARPTAAGARACAATLDHQLAWETRLWLLGSCVLATSAHSSR